MGAQLKAGPERAAKRYAEFTSVKGVSPGVGNRIDPITFIEDPNLLGWKLFLGQRALVKVIYGMPLDSEERDFLATVPEEYGYPIAPTPAGGFSPNGYSESLLVLGRRSGKTRIISGLAIYEATTRDWREMGKIHPNDFAYVVVVATRLEQAEQLGRRNIYEGLLRSKDLKHFVVPESRMQGQLGKKSGDILPAPGRSRIPIDSYGMGPKLRAPVAEPDYDDDDYSPLKSQGSTQKQLLLYTGNGIMALPCNSRAARGYAIFDLILDECAHYFRETSTQSSERDVYDALRPGMIQFGSMKRICRITTPCGAQGAVHDDFQKRHDPVFAHRFVMHAPTYLMNPEIEAEEYEKEEAEDPIRYQQEYLALFLSRAEGIIDLEMVDAAFDQRPYRAEPKEGRGTVMALDPAFRNDTFAIMIGHAEPKDRTLYIDHVEGMSPRKQSGWQPGKKQGLVVDELNDPSKKKQDKATRDKLAQKAPVLSEDAVERVAYLYERWQCEECWTDQAVSALLIPQLRARGINVKLLTYGNNVRRQMYATVKTAFETGRVIVSLSPNEFANRCRQKFRGELKTIRVTNTATGSYSITKGGGKTDDYCDACAMLLRRLWHRARLGSLGDMAGFSAFRGNQDIVLGRDPRRALPAAGAVQALKRTGARSSASSRAIRSAYPTHSHAFDRALPHPGALNGLPNPGGF